MINKVILIGNLGKDPEVRYTADGTAVATFSLATSEKWTDRNNGEKKEATEWHRVVAWKGLAENCGKYLSKGSKVYVEGKLQTRSWEKDGITRYATEIVAGTIRFLSTPGSGGRSQRNEPPSYGEYDNGFSGQSGNPDDDIPF